MRKLFIASILVLLTGCVTPPRPQSFDDHVAAIRTALTAAAERADRLCLA